LCVLLLLVVVVSGTIPLPHYLLSLMLVIHSEAGTQPSFT